jgi:hypothetical protein
MLGKKDSRQKISRKFLGLHIVDAGTCGEKTISPVLAAPLSGIPNHRSDR